MQDVNQTQAERMVKMRKHFNLNQRQLASIIGRNPPVIKGIEHGRTKKIRPEYLKIFEKRLGISPIWLTDGKGDMFVEEIDHDEILKQIELISKSFKSDDIEIPFSPGLDLDYSSSIRLTKDFLVIPVAKKYIRAVQNEDKAMDPTISPKDVVLVNINDFSLDEGNIYLVNVDGQNYIRRLFFDVGSSDIVLKADNSLYPHFKLKHSQIEVKGKIFTSISIKVL